MVVLSLKLVLLEFFLFGQSSQDIKHGYMLVAWTNKKKTTETLQ